MKRELLTSLKDCTQGNYMIGVWRIRNGKILFDFFTEDFPVADFEKAKAQLDHATKKEEQVEAI